MDADEMSRDRQLAIKLMVRCGWTHHREKKAHVFTDPKSADFFGVTTARVTHKNLSIRWALGKCRHPELHRRLHEATMAWLAEFMPEAA